MSGRSIHYAQFYELEPVPTGRPVVAVHGNCQAESLRVLLDDDQVTAVRIPPVFELIADDLPHLRTLLARTDLFVSQPIVDDYRGLPLGTAQVAALLPAHARVVRVPPLRHNGPYPYQVIVRVPGEGDPPVVPYHDLRTVLDAAEGRVRERRFTADGYREVAARSLAELRRREEAHATVPVADVIAQAGADSGLTINHPSNRVLIGVARRVQEALGLQPTAADPGRVLLREVSAPLREDVLEALGVDATPREAWTYRGERIDDDEVRATQRAWFAERPHAVQAALRRHAGLLDLLRG